MNNEVLLIYYDELYSIVIEGYTKEQSISILQGYKAYCAIEENNVTMQWYLKDMLGLNVSLTKMYSCDITI